MDNMAAIVKHYACIANVQIMHANQLFYGTVSLPWLAQVCINREQLVELCNITDPLWQIDKKYCNDTIIFKMYSSLSFTPCLASLSLL